MLAKLKANSKQERINNIRMELSSIDGSKKIINNTIKRISKDLVNIEKEKNVATKSVMLLDYVINNSHDNIINMFEKAISGALKDLFDSSYEFKFEFGKRGTAMTCEYMIKMGDCHNWLTLKMCHGTSIKEIIGVIIRIIFVKIKNNLANVVILDEPLSGLSPEKQVLAGKFLVEIAEKFNIQIISVSHSERISSYASKRIEI